MRLGLAYDDPFPIGYAMTYDAAIIGAGPAGLTLAGALAREGLSVALIDPADAGTLAAPPDDGCEIALTALSRELLTQWRQWPLLAPDEITAMHEAQVFDGDAQVPMSVRAPAGAEALGWMVSNRALRRIAYQAAAQAPGIDWHLSRRARALENGPDGARVRLDDGRMLEARLVVAADSRFSEARRMAGLPARHRDFGRSMLVCRMRLERPRPGIAWECLDYGQTLALLPLGGDLASVVITLPPAEIARLQTLPAEAFARETAERYRGRLGTMRLEGERHVYPLVGVCPDRLVAGRFACVGDAAIGMHPITAHGYNLGLRGIGMLVRRIRSAIETGGDIAAPALLAGYERELQAISRPLYLATESIVRVYTDDRAPVRLLRRAGLRFGGGFAPFRHALATTLSGRELSPPLPLRVLGRLLSARRPRLQAP